MSEHSGKSSASYSYYEYSQYDDEDGEKADPGVIKLKLDIQQKDRCFCHGSHGAKGSGCGAANDVYAGCEGDGDATPTGPGGVSNPSMVTTIHHHYYYGGVLDSCEKTGLQHVVSNPLSSIPSDGKYGPSSGVQQTSETRADDGIRPDVLFSRNITHGRPWVTDSSDGYIRQGTVVTANMLRPISTNESTVTIPGITIPRLSIPQRGNVYFRNITDPGSYFQNVHGKSSGLCVNTVPDVPSVTTDSRQFGHIRTATTHRRLATHGHTTVYSRQFPSSAITLERDREYRERDYPLSVGTAVSECANECDLETYCNIPVPLESLERITLTFPKILTTYRKIEYDIMVPWIIEVPVPEPLPPGFEPGLYTYVNYQNGTQLINFDKTKNWNPPPVSQNAE